MLHTEGEGITTRRASGEGQTSSGPKQFDGWRGDVVGGGIPVGPPGFKATRTLLERAKYALKDIVASPMCYCLVAKAQT